MKWAEDAGARVVPLVEDEGWDVTLEKLSRLNGVLFPGGGSNYRKFGHKIYKAVKQYNDDGQFYPLWGTCLGFQYMARWASSNPYKYPGVLERLESKKEMLTLDFTADISEIEQSKMFEDWDDPQEFSDNAWTYNWHRWGVALETFGDGPDGDAALHAFYNPTSTSIGSSTGTDVEFVATMEAYDYPFMGVQFHPEKVGRVFN